jgi:membrane associated rhomboid family serine protease
MSRGADLFVVCKNCGSEVSPYVTECPYCGQRVRKRAPKIDRGGPGGGGRGRRPKRAKAPRPPRLSRLRRDEIPGLRADITARPWVTIALVAASFGVYLGAAANAFNPIDLMLFGGLPAHDEPSWRIFTAPFVHYSGGNSVFAGGAYGFATMLAVGTFGWLLEKRHGAWLPLLLYVLAGAGGMLVAAEVDPDVLAGGANGLALGLLCCWAVPDLLAWRRGDDWEGDLLGTGVMAAVLLTLPLGVDLASPYAGFAGALVGLAVGWPLARSAER